MGCLWRDLLCSTMRRIRSVSAICLVLSAFGADAWAKETVRPKTATAKSCRAVALERPRLLAVEKTVRERIFAFRMKAPAMNPRCEKFGRRNIAAWLETTALIRNTYGQLRRIAWAKAPDSGTALGNGNVARSTRTLVKFLPWQMCTPPESDETTKILSRDARVAAATLWRPAGQPDILTSQVRPSADAADLRRNVKGVGAGNQLRHQGAVKRLCGDGGPPPP